MQNINENNKILEKITSATSKSNDLSNLEKPEKIINKIKNVKNPIWLSASEAAKLGGVQTKTIRRAIKSNELKYKIVFNRYSINLSSLIIYLNTKIKLRNKLNKLGIGQYIKKWKE